jgi:hypothetical protein
VKALMGWVLAGGWLLWGWRVQRRLRRALVDRGYDSLLAGMSTYQAIIVPPIGLLVLAVAGRRRTVRKP